jgi:hypothetical protein
VANNPSSGLRAAVARTERRAPSDDSLEILRARVRYCRSLELDIADAEERLRALKAELNQVLGTELPDLFDEHGVQSVGIPAEGNSPAYVAETKPYYKAKLPENNPGPGLQWLVDHGHGDLPKHVFKIEIGRGREADVEEIEKALDLLGIDFDHTMTVPWNTLTAFVREQIEEHNATLPLDLLGATVGRVVRLKEKK